MGPGSSRALPSKGDKKYLLTQFPEMMHRELVPAGTIPVAPRPARLTGRGRGARGRGLSQPQPAGQIPVKSSSTETGPEGSCPRGGRRRKRTRLRRRSPARRRPPSPPPGPRPRGQRAEPPDSPGGRRRSRQGSGCRDTSGERTGHRPAEQEGSCGRDHPRTRGRWRLGSSLRRPGATSRVEERTRGGPRASRSFPGVFTLLEGESQSPELSPSTLCVSSPLPR